MENQTCLNCGHEQQVTKENTYHDELGKHTVCEECEASCDLQ